MLTKYIFAFCLMTSQSLVSAEGSYFHRLQSWQRLELKGTGLSVESPEVYRVDQEKPQSWEKDYTAHVRHSLSYQGIYSTVVYSKKPDEKLLPRHKLEETAAILKHASSVQRITDLTFLGEQAALLEDEFTDKLKLRRKMVVFGKPGELWSFNIVYPREASNITAIAERIFKSLQRAGQVAEETSLYPPIEWSRQEFGGLFFDSPTAQPDPNCRATEIAKNYSAMTRCFKWGNDLSIKVSRRFYTGAVPTSDAAAREDLKNLIEFEKEFPTTQAKERTISGVSVAGADAAKLREFTSLGTVGAIDETFFIRRGNDFWKVSVYNFIERKASELAKRVAASLGFTKDPTTATSPATAMPTNPAIPAVPTASSYIANGDAYAVKSEHEKAVAEYLNALKLEPQNGRALFKHALSLEKLGRLNEAVNSYSGAIQYKYSLREAHYNRGTVLYHLKRYLSAILDFASAIKIDPKYVSAYYNRGLANHAFNQVDSALADFNKVIEFDPRHINARIMRARIYCSKGLTMSATQDQNAVIEMGGQVERGCR